MERAAWCRGHSRNLLRCTFYGADKWRRLSDAWFEFSLEDSEIAMEIASRLVDYLETLEPILAGHDLNC